MSLVGAGGGSGLYPEGTYRPGIRVRLTADSVPASAWPAGVGGINCVVVLCLYW